MSGIKPPSPQVIDAGTAVLRNAISAEMWWGDERELVMWWGDERELVKEIFLAMLRAFIEDMLIRLPHTNAETY
jgi:hypothetical protein